MLVYILVISFHLTSYCVEVSGKVDFYVKVIGL